MSYGVNDTCTNKSGVRFWESPRLYNRLFSLKKFKNGLHTVHVGCVRRNPDCDRYVNAKGVDGFQFLSLGI